MAAQTECDGCATVVALRVADSPQAAATACTLLLGSGVRLTMSCLPAPEWLAALARAAETR